MEITVSKDGNSTKLTPIHPDETAGYALLAQSLGTNDVRFLNGFLNQLADLNSKGARLNETGLNFVLSIVGGVKPIDQIEAMLAAQMATVHLAIMTAARRLANAETVQQQDIAERMFNKLARTFTTLVEALKRYRTGGEQKMTIQHVTVSEGGHAIVGQLTQLPCGNLQPLASPDPLDPLVVDEHSARRRARLPCDSHSSHTDGPLCTPLRQLLATDDSFPSELDHALARRQGRQSDTSGGIARRYARSEGGSCT